MLLLPKLKRETILAVLNSYYTVEHATTPMGTLMTFLLSYSQMLCTELKKSSGGDLFLHVF